MNWGIVGALIGLAIGIADFFILRMLAQRQDAPSQAQVAIKLASYISLVIFPIVGWYAGTSLFGAE